MHIRKTLWLILWPKSQGGLISLFDHTATMDVFTDSSEAVEGGSRTENVQIFVYQQCCESELGLMDTKVTAAHFGKGTCKRHACLPSPGSVLMSEEPVQSNMKSEN